MSPITALAARGPDTPPLWRPPPRPGEPAWLATRRREATGWVEEHGFPTIKHEDWRYTRLEALLEVPFEPAPGDVLLPEVAGKFGGHLGGPRLVLVNGQLIAELSEGRDLPAGTRIGSLGVALSEGHRPLERLWAPPPGGYAHAFRALSDALAIDGAFIALPARAAMDLPIEVVYVTVGTEQPVLASPRLVVLAGPGSRATIVESFHGAGPGPGLTNALTQVVLGEGASIDHYKVQAEDVGAFHMSSLEVQPARASCFRSCLLALGACLGRHEVVAHLEAEQATVQLDGLFLPTGTQHHDNPVLVDHAAPKCTSHQLFKGIVSDRASGVFNGHVVVRPGAAGTDAHQVNKNLLLSEQAQVYTRPRLEIFADEVACTHGAAVGQLDEDALFYLRSRGIPERAARALLIGGFAEELLDRWPAGPLQDYARELVAARLGAGDQPVRP